MKGLLCHHFCDFGHAALSSNESILSSVPDLFPDDDDSKHIIISHIKNKNSKNTPYTTLIALTDQPHTVQSITTALTKLLSSIRFLVLVVLGHSFTHRLHELELIVMCIALMLEV